MSSGRRLPRACHIWWTTLVCAFAAGCAQEPPGLDAAFRVPSGLALAGPAESRYLFVANSNEDSLQVVELGANASQVRLVDSPAQYFPLRIPAGPEPTDLAATPGGAYVVVLNPTIRSVRVVDTETLRRVRTADGDAFVGQVGAPDSQPAALVADPSECDEPCLGRFYVALRRQGRIAHFALERDGETLSWRALENYDVGGSPNALAVHPDGSTVFAADVAQNAVLRLTLSDGSVVRRPLDTAPGALAVSRDGQVVLVSRPRWQDVLLLEEPNGAEFGALDANTRLAPSFRCINACAEDGPCTQVHPADQAMCIQAEGLATSDTGVYSGLYLGLPVAQLLPLGSSANHPELRVHCSGSDARRRFSEYALAVGLNGSIRFIGLRRANGDLSPELASSGWCQAPELLPPEAESDAGAPQPLEQVLAGCPSTPGDRQRVQCVTSGAAGVLTFPGRTGEQRWRLRWEGVLPDLQRSQGGGRLLSEGTRFTDTGINLANTNVQPGDWLQILTPPQPTAACQEALGGASEQCALERAIDAIEGGELVLREPVEPSCFMPDMSIAYQVRAGGQYLVFRDGQLLGRLEPGERLGPSGTVAPESSVVFQTQAFEPRLALSACERYDAAGRPREPLAAALRRDGLLGFRVRDPFAPIRAGQQFDGAGQEAGTVGALPAGVAVAPPTEDAEALVFVSYPTANAILGFAPFETLGLFEPERYQVIR